MICESCYEAEATELDLVTGNHVCAGCYIGPDMRDVEPDPDEELMLDDLEQQPGWPFD